MMSPSWVASADRALLLASENIKLIRAVTPNNWASELALLTESFERGSPRLPRFRYDDAKVPVELRAALERLGDFLEKHSPLGEIYAARARELSWEAAIVDAVGTAKVRVPAARRFVGTSPADLADLKRADELADAWLQARAPWEREPEVLGGQLGEASQDRDAEELVSSDDRNDQRSLVSAMAREVGRYRLPMRVVVVPSLASLAATGDGVIFVAEGRRVRPRDVERTVLHEIAGHALPRARALAAPLGIFALGTARGVDDQEGRSLLIERAAGFLDAGRRRELALRHTGARATLDGANFLEVVDLLLARSAPLATAVRIAARVQRGGMGIGGLGREVVYLPSFLRVERALSNADGHNVDAAMAGGRIAVDVAPVLLAALSPDKTEDVSKRVAL